METDGAGGGGGGEAESSGRSELRRLLEAIGSSEVLEKRIPLIEQLEEEFCADGLGLILQGLLASWVDFTCSGVSHCTLHRSILQVALKCSDLEITDHLGQFLTLGAKASSWSGKHVHWSAKCIDQSQVTEEEEHDRLRLEVNSLSLSISAKLLDIAAKCITVTGLEVAKGEDGHGAKKEECVSTKAEDTFPTLETMAMDVEPAPAHVVAGVSPNQEASHRCTDCASEKTPQWRLKRPPADSPAFSLVSHGPVLKRRRKSEAQTFASIRRTAKVGRAIRAAARLSAMDKGDNAFSTLETMTVDVEPVPAHPAVGMRQGAMGRTWSLASSPQGASRRWGRCTRCTSANTQRWYPGPDGPGTLCRACWYRFMKGQPPQHNHRRRQYCTSNKHSPCMHCGAEQTPRWLRGPAGPGTLCSACGQRFLIGRLIPVDSKKPRQLLHSNPLRRRCMHCGSENTPRWLKGPDGPATLCDSCGRKFYKGRLLHYKSRRGSSSNEDSVAGNDVAALAEALPCGVGASLDAFFENTGSEVPCGKGAGPEEEEELEWLSNKDAFPSVETMAVEVEEKASAPDAPRARTNGQRRVTAIATAGADRVIAAEADHGKEPMEEQLLPERPPADSPGFSLVSHGPVIKRRRKSEAQTFASIRRTAKAGRAIRAAARLATMDN